MAHTHVVGPVVLSVLPLCVPADYPYLLENSLLFYPDLFATFWHTEKNIKIHRKVVIHRSRYFVGPDLGKNCLQKLSPDDTWR